MELPTKRSGRPRSQMSRIADARRSGPKAERRMAVSALEVTDVVRYGTGRGSRIDLTIGCAGHRARITGIRAKHVLSYGQIAKSAIEEGLVLPYERSANRAWRKVLSRAMEQARVEPWLEGEEIADAIAAEIRALLEDCHRGKSGSDLMAGKVVEQPGRLLASPRSLVPAVRSRLVDDVLPQAKIAEAAAAHLGMRESRRRFADGRPRAWVFPRPLPAARENREMEELRLDEGASSMPGEEREAPGDAQESTEHGVGGTEANWIRSMDRRAAPTSPLPREGCELDPLDRKNGVSPDPVHGPKSLSDISPTERGIRGGSSGPRKWNFAVDPVQGTAVPRDAFTVDKKRHSRTSRPRNGWTKP